MADRPSALPGPQHAHLLRLDRPSQTLAHLLTDDQLRRSDHRSVQALETDIRAWVKAWNDNPRPFLWTKTAERTLNSSADF